MKVAIPKAEKTRDKSKRKTCKSIPLKAPQIRSQLDETGKLSVAQCKAILTKDGAAYSDEQVVLIRQVLYALAEVDYRYHCNLKSQDNTATTIPFSTTNITTHDEQQNSYSLHPRINRRAA